MVSNVNLSVSPIEAKARHCERTAVLYEDVAASCQDFRRRMRFLDLADEHRMAAIVWRTAERSVQRGVS